MLNLRSKVSPIVQSTVYKLPLKAEMKIALLNQQPQGRDYQLNIILKYGEPLGAEADAVICGNCFLGSINLDPYIHRGYLHIRIVSVQF